MISPEVLRRFPFFGSIEPEYLRQIAMFSEELSFDKDATIFVEGDQANALYFLISGSVDLFFSVTEETRPDEHKEYYTGSINPGEMTSFNHYALGAVAEEDFLRRYRLDTRDQAPAEPGPVPAERSVRPALPRPSLTATPSSSIISATPRPRRFTGSCPITR